MTILLIDDDLEDQEYFCIGITEINPAVICLTAKDGIEALSKLNSLDCLPDKIFLDINMPGMDGQEFLQVIKSIDRLKRIPIIILSTSGKLKESTLIQLGATHVIDKPSSFSEMRQIFEPHIL